MKDHGLPENYIDSVVLIQGNKRYTNSEAALRTFAVLDGPIHVLASFLVVPRVLRDAVYSTIANNRYRVFGRSDVCKVPSSDIRAKFIDQEDSGNEKSFFLFSLSLVSW